MSVSRTKQTGLLRARNRGGTSDHALAGLEDALANAGMRPVDNDAGISRFIGKILKRLGLLRAIYHRPDGAYFLALMGPQRFRVFPYGYTSELIPFVFDCWPAEYDEWERFFRQHRVRLAFFTARKSAEAMSGRIEGLEAVWMPEAIDTARYLEGKPFAERTIDLLELGRRSEDYHQKITGHCERRGYRHLYQKGPQQLVFESREDLLHGLADTRVLVCFPSSLTNPERSGEVETLTLRYLEGIANGCILLGHCPAELQELFGYDPVVAADMDAPGHQLDAILADPGQHEHLTRRNLQRLREVGTWDRRAETILSALRARGYRI